LLGNAAAHPLIQLTRSDDVILFLLWLLLWLAVLLLLLLPLLLAPQHMNVIKLLQSQVQRHVQQ
jgi:hypothetical protein